MTEIRYPINISPISEKDGRGFLITCRDLPGCMADGESIEEALKECEDAIQAWIETAKAEGSPVPEPNSAKNFSGQFRLRVPKSLHAKLAATAEEEQVSLNTVAVALLAAGLAKKSPTLRDTNC